MDCEEANNKRILEFIDRIKKGPPSIQYWSGPCREFKPDPVISGSPKRQFVPLEIFKTPKFKPLDLFDCQSSQQTLPEQSSTDDCSNKSQ